MADMWLKRDIANALNAAYQNAGATVIALADDRERAALYLAGYRAALATLATFFGVKEYGEQCDLVGLQLLNKR